MRVAVKICGFVRPRDVETALELDIDAIGIMLDPCVRQVSPTAARQLLRVAQGSHVLKVAVTGRISADAIEPLVEMGFDIVQAVLTADEFARTEREVSVLPVVFDGPEAEARSRALLRTWNATEPRAESPLGRLNLDGAAGGGRGLRVDDALALRLASQTRLMLSGGLTPENVAPIVSKVRPVAVDVTSATESDIGVKDPMRIRRFVEAVRLGEASNSTSDVCDHMG
ncbi:MAG: hypothetical protein ACFB9M_14000 [Myxococcota bacterium]